jgi:hypothetical protein
MCMWMYVHVHVGTHPRICAHGATARLSLALCALRMSVRNVVTDATRAVSSRARAYTPMHIVLSFVPEFFTCFSHIYKKTLCVGYRHTIQEPETATVVRVCSLCDTLLCHPLCSVGRIFWRMPRTRNGPVPQCDERASEQLNTPRPDDTLKPQASQAERCTRDGCGA